MDIADHGLIGDCRSAALVAKDGTVDWMCWPRFDSPSVFAALIDGGRTSAGAFRITPMGGGFKSSQRYLDATNVLQTEFTNGTDRVVITDLMPVSVTMKDRVRPEHELLRIVQCERGRVRMETELLLAPGYGNYRVRLHDLGANTWRVDSRSGSFFVRSEVPLKVNERGALCAEFPLEAGQTVRLSLSYSTEGPAALPLLGHFADEALVDTTMWWRMWSRRCTYKGPFEDEVLRSALALKLMAYSPSGAIIAAPTTSLPEAMGGSLNWDYRFCWLRDASLTARSLIGLGFTEEATAFIYWLLHFTEMTQPKLRVLYDVFGKRPTQEKALEQFEGFGGSRPVRIGNAAEVQLQLDLYGEVVDAVATWVEAGGELDKPAQSTLTSFGRYVSRNWRMRDQGIWELRNAGEAHTHSRLMCWVALDRLLGFAARGMLPKLEIAEARLAREAVRRDIRHRAWRPHLRSYSGVLDRDDLDSAVLMLPWHEFEAAQSPRMRGTYQAVTAQLGAGDGLLYRNKELRDVGDGAFVLCGFWAAELLADGCGTRDDAMAVFQGLLSQRNELGLLAEEVDPKTGKQMGNFPQAFSHVGLISAALAIEEREARGDEPVVPAQAEASAWM